jgi:LysR family hydrogen peroxide-inducible transcriptional activator
METLPLGEDSFHVALPRGHHLAARDSVPVAALAGERLMLLEDGHCLRAHAEAACGLPRGLAAGEEEFAATSLHTLVQMVASGLGVTLLPELAIAGGVLAGAPVEVRPLEGAAAPARLLALAWRPRSPRATEFRGLGQAVSAALAQP